MEALTDSTAMKRGILSTRKGAKQLAKSKQFSKLLRISSRAIPNAFVCAQLLSCAQLLETPQTVAYQAPLSMEFSRQEHWSGLPFPSLSHTLKSLFCLLQAKSHYQKLSY